MVGTSCMATDADLMLSLPASTWVVYPLHLHYADKSNLFNNQELLKSVIISYILITLHLTHVNKSSHPKVTPPLTSRSYVARSKVMSTKLKLYRPRFLVMLADARNPEWCRSRSYSEFREETITISSVSIISVRRKLLIKHWMLSFSGIVL